MVVFNRLLWTLIGLLLLAIGVAGVAVAVGFGALGSTLARTAVVPAVVAQHAIAPTDNDLIALALVGLLALLLGLVLLRAELRVPGQPGMRDLRYARSNAEQNRGRTVVRAGGLEHGLRQSLGALPGVRMAHAKLAGNSERPNLLVELEVDEKTRLSTLKSEVAQAIERFRLTSGRQPSTQVRIRLVKARRSVD